MSQFCHWQCHHEYGIVKLNLIHKIISLFVLVLRNPTLVRWNFCIAQAQECIWICLLYYTNWQTIPCWYNGIKSHFIIRIWSLSLTRITSSSSFHHFLTYLRRVPFKYALKAWFFKGLSVKNVTNIAKREINK